MNSLSLGQGQVFHQRQEGGAHQFSYPTYFLFFRCNEELSLTKLFKTHFRGMLCLKSENYLGKDVGPVNDKIKTFLRDRCNYEAEEIWLLTMPSVFGYAFNPVSFWFCRRQTKLEAVLVEVNNTFGERHFYWIFPKGGISSTEVYRTEKIFHVSPFFPVDGYYQFQFRLDPDKVRVDINHYASDHKLRLATWISGKFSDLSENSLFPILRKYGWITLMVIVRIHFQALLIWFKKNRYHAKPAPPRQEITQ